MVGHYADKTKEPTCAQCVLSLNLTSGGVEAHRDPLVPWSILVMSSSKGATNRKRQREKMRGRCVDRKNRQRKRVTERLLARRDYFENMRAHSRNMSLKTMRGFSG